MLTLASDALAPTTSEIGFLNRPLVDTIDALRTWRAELGDRVTFTPVQGTLAEMVRRLEPLTTLVRPRELVVQTANPSWTAYFDCSANGTDPVSFVGYLSRTLHSRGLIVTAIPDTFRIGRPGSGRLGAVVMELYGPEGDVLNFIRAISLTNQGPRWKFEAVGVPQDFEDESSYSARRVRDRFTSAKLNSYCEQLGLSPFDMSFYGREGSLLLTDGPLPDGVTQLTLEQAQDRKGIKPGSSEEMPK
jgi:hypothetical protein